MIPLYGAPEGYDALLLARRAGEHAGPLLHVARDDARMARLAEALGFFAPKSEILQFPAWDCLPYDRVSPNSELIAERIAALERLLSPAPGSRVVLTTVNALVQRVPPRHVFRDSSLRVSRGGSIQAAVLTGFLEATAMAGQARSWNRASTRCVAGSSIFFRRVVLIPCGSISSGT